MTSTINANTSGGLISTGDTSGVLALQTGGTTAVTIDASQNVGIGTSSNLTKLTLGSGTFRIKNASTDSNGMLLYQDTADVSRIYNYYSGPLVFGTSNTERMRIDSSGNIGINNTSPSTFGKFVMQVQGTTTPTNATNIGPSSINLYPAGNAGSTNCTTGIFGWLDPTPGIGAGIGFSRENSVDWGSQIRFYTHPTTTSNIGDITERMRIDSSGNLLVGKTTKNNSSGNGFQVESNGTINVVTASSSGTFDTYELYSTGAGAYRFYVTASGTVSATNTSISAISDIRLKENIRDLNVGLAEVLALKPRLYDWKEGKGANIKNARGFIAQEFEQIFPDLIDTWKDPAPEGEDPYKSVRQDLVPVLVKAIQEQQTIIQTLTSRIEALENK